MSLFFDEVINKGVGKEINKSLFEEYEFYEHNIEEDREVFKLKCAQNHFSELVFYVPDRTMDNLKELVFVRFMHWLLRNHYKVTVTEIIISSEYHRKGYKRMNMMVDFLRELSTEDYYIRSINKAFDFKYLCADIQDKIHVNCTDIYINNDPNYKTPSTSDYDDDDL